MRGVYISGLQRIVVGSSKMLNELMLQGSMIRTQVLAPGRALTTSVGVREWLGGVGQSLAMVLVLWGSGGDERERAQLPQPLYLHHRPPAARLGQPDSEHVRVCTCFLVVAVCSGGATAPVAVIVTD